jgi:RNA polymerase sigma-70 factor (ECF subfamily)
MRRAFLCTSSKHLSSRNRRAGTATRLAGTGYDSAKGGALGKESQPPRRSVTYCVVPEDLAAKLHEPLRRHFAREAGRVEVVVERRRAERRGGKQRRSATAEVAVERRKVLGPLGRRLGERRDALVEVEPPAVLPGRARPHAPRIVFYERLEPSGQQLEDVDTARTVVRFQQGDPDAFVTLYMRYFDRVYAYLRVALGESAAAEDLTQQVFMSVWQALPRYEVRAGIAFRRWLFVIARHAVLSDLKRRGRVDVLEPDELALVTGAEAAPEDGAGALPLLDWISDRDLLLFIERLPEAQRQVLALRYLLDLPYSEIARVMDRSQVDVRSLHSRGVRFLRARLAGLGRAGRDSRPVRMRSPLRQPPVIGARRWALHA